MKLSVQDAGVTDQLKSLINIEEVRTTLLKDVAFSSKLYDQKFLFDVVSERANFAQKVVKVEPAKVLL